MKKLMLLITLFILSFTQNKINAQATWGFNHTIWTMEIPDGSGGIIGYSYSTLDALNPDTLINSTSYKKILDEYGTYYYGIRSYNHKVYGFDNYFFPSQEYLMYDFTANVGDTIRKVAIGDNYNFLDTANFYVIAKDSFFLNNKYYIALEVEANVSSGTIHSYWYENVGNIHGIMETNATVVPLILVCYSNNDSIVDLSHLPISSGFNTIDTISIYQGNNCIGVGINEVTENNEIFIYSNPFTEQFTVNSEQLTVKEIKVMDVLGREVLRQAQDNKSVTIDVSGIAKGIYFIEVRTDNSVSSPHGNIIRKKIIKE